MRNLAYAFFVHNEWFFTSMHKKRFKSTNDPAECRLSTSVQW